MKAIYLTTVLAPLIGALLIGLGGRRIAPRIAYAVAIGGVALSFLLSLAIFRDAALHGNRFNGALYGWMTSGGVRFEIGFLIDSLTATMLVVVTAVSLAVHIYTIGYMADDPGRKRFFCYISLFTFAMLTLVTANNFLQLFFGWEAVGLISYLLIGFWFQRESAIRANLKAFLVNRVGDFGFLLGIAAVLYWFGSLDYATVFARADAMTGETVALLPGVHWSAMTVVCILLFIGAMGKSAQVPLHVWLPDSMEGPTPISALIHAATMVTAGIFMVARMSPLFELSETALSVVLTIGAITALSMGLLGLVQNDIKRVIAYSTLSQLGYMTVALGASAYGAAIFHLTTHAFFKALLFLAAGSVIIALHHEQDMRRMGGLWRRMPITCGCMWVGALALSGFPGLSGFFSKDAIIEAVHASTLPGAGFAYAAVLIGVLITALYTFRLLFLTFHGPARWGQKEGAHAHAPHETGWTVTGPLLALAIPSVVIGAIALEPMLFGGLFDDAIHVRPEHAVLARLGAEYAGLTDFVLHGLLAPPFWLASAGLAAAWFLYLKRPDLPDALRRRFSLVYTALINHYGFDAFNERFFAGGGRALGGLLWQFGDVRLIDGLLVNGTARGIGRIAAAVRRFQSGYLYHYAFVMVVALMVMLAWVVYG